MSIKRVACSMSPAVFYISVFLFTSICKVMPVIGSRCAFFSGTNFLMPLTGVLGGTPLLALVVVYRFIRVGAHPFLFLVRYLPGICAATSWHTQSVWLRVVLPVVCMGLFFFHPVAGNAWVYSLYWLIPVVLHARGTRAPFAHALSSTFVAHAVGSVIWAYTIPMTVAQWYALIPVVACERLLFASGMTLMHDAVRVGARVAKHTAEVVRAYMLRLV